MAMAAELSCFLSNPVAGLPSAFPAYPHFLRRRRPMPAPLRVSSPSTSSSSQLDKSYPVSIGEHDLLIVGPGVLGRIVAGKWRQEYPNCQVFGETFSSDHHDELLKLGINPFVKGSEEIQQQIPFIIYCAPPSRSPDYPGDVRQATSRWNGDGSFLFTSSSAVFDCNDNGFCEEDSPIVPLGRSPRTDLLLKAENVVLEAAGCVLRLAGLYKADRGAHSFWLRKGKVNLRSDHMLNLIHYEDAASLSVAILKKKLKGHVLLGCDNSPVSRQELMDCVNKSGKFSQKFEAFTGTSDPLGKQLNNTKTRSKIGWKPKYSSFAEFLEMQ